MAKILLVEDDNNLREIYEARLQAEGYTIVSAQDGEEALVKAKQEKPDLVISDVMMPRVSGFEMLDILRNTEGLKDTKVIMLTALGQAEDKTRADTLGADRYLVKSQVTLEDIVQAADELLKDAGVVPAAAPTTPQDTDSTGQGSPAPDATAVAPAAAPVAPQTASIPMATPPEPAAPAAPTPAEPAATVPAAEPAATSLETPAPSPEPTQVTPAPVDSTAAPTTPAPRPEVPETTPEVTPSEKPEAPAAPQQDTASTQDTAAPTTAATPVVPLAAPATDVAAPTAPEPADNTAASPAPSTEPAVPTTPAEPPVAPSVNDDQTADDQLMADAVKQLGGTVVEPPADAASDNATTPAEPDTPTPTAPEPAAVTPVQTTSDEPVEAPVEPEATAEAAEPTAVQPPAAPTMPVPEPAEATDAATSAADEQALMQEQINQFVQQQGVQPEPAAVPTPTSAPELATPPAPADEAPTTEPTPAPVAEEAPDLTAPISSQPAPTVIAPETTTSDTAAPTTPAPRPEVPETTPEVAPSEKPEAPAAPQTVAPTTEQPAPEATEPEAPTTDDDNVTVAGKKIIQPPVEPIKTRPDLNELLAKEGIGSLDEHQEAQQPTSPYNTPHQPGHVISPNGTQEAPDLTARPAVAAPAPVAAPTAPNPSDPNNIAL